METMSPPNTLNFIAGWKSSQFLPENQVENALEYLQNTPFPTTKNEAWKYTRLAALSKKQFTFLTPKAFRKALVNEDFYGVYFSNGHSSLGIENSDFKGFTLRSIQSQKVDNSFVEAADFFGQLNTAFAQDGVYLHVEKNQKVDLPIVIHHDVDKGGAAITRNEFVVESGGEATVIFVCNEAQGADSFSHQLNRFEVHPNGRLTVYKLQYPHDQSFHFSQDHAVQHKDSYFHILTATLDGKIVRNDLRINVDGQNCDTHLNGLYLGSGDMHVDNHTVVDHLQPNCESNELYKGVMTDKSTAVFNGKVFVRRDAQKINAFQSNGNVLLSADASVNSKPELEIYADDVKCSHGSTTGQLDEQAVYYLRTRGLSEASARQLMVSAFIGDVIEKIDNRWVKEQLACEMKKRMGWDFMG